MILYHFTNFAQFGMTKPGEFEWTADLKPFRSTEWTAEILGFAPPPMVWLTTEPNPKRTWVDASGKNVSGVRLRVTVDLDRNSRRLVRFADYLRQRAPWLDYAGISNTEARGAWGGPEAVWVYFGTIARARHRAVCIHELVCCEAAA
jgi:hypothetical protein